MANVPTVACTNCGKPFTTDDLRGTNCKYCGTLLAHHARAQQQVAVINQMMADRNGNGIPDAYEGIVANAQANALNQAFGMGAAPYAPMGAPPAMGAPPMNNPYGNPYGNPMMNPYANVNAQVSKAMSRAMLIVVISIVFVIVLTMGIGFLTFALR